MAKKTKKNSNKNSTVTASNNKSQINLSKISYIMIPLAIVIVIIYELALVIAGTSIYGSDEDKTAEETVEKIYYCPSGYELFGSKCVKIETVPSTKRYYCVSGTLSGTQCVVDIWLSSTTTEECPSGYTTSGSRCQKIGTFRDYSKCGSNKTYSYSTGLCYPEVYPTEKTICYYGELVGNRCRSYTYVDANYTYECPAGYTQKYEYDGSCNICTKETVINAYIK